MWRLVVLTVFLACGVLGLKPCELKNNHRRDWNDVKVRWVFPVGSVVYESKIHRVLKRDNRTQAPYHEDELVHETFKLCTEEGTWVKTTTDLKALFKDERDENNHQTFAAAIKQPVKVYDLDFPGGVKETFQFPRHLKNLFTKEKTILQSDSRLFESIETGGVAGKWTNYRFGRGTCYVTSKVVEFYWKPEQGTPRRSVDSTGTKWKWKETTRGPIVIGAENKQDKGVIEKSERCQDLLKYKWWTPPPEMTPRDIEDHKTAVKLNNHLIESRP